MKEKESDKTEEHPKNNDAITIKKESLWKYSTFILLAIVIIGGFYIINNDAGPPEASGAVAAANTAGIITANVKNAPFKGEENAPVTIVEYTDYQCPYCSRYFLQTYSQIISNYVDKGKVKYYLKDFPLSFHQYAQKAAEATHCVREQAGDDGFFAMHDKIFIDQQNLNLDNLKKWAREIKDVDGAAFDSCLDDGKMESVVKESFQDGQKEGIKGTPGFFINEKLLSGAQPYTAFQQMIEAELA